MIQNSMVQEKRKQLFYYILYLSLPNILNCYIDGNKPVE